MELTSEQQQLILELLNITPRSNKEILAFLSGDESCDVSDDVEAESDFSDEENDF